AAAPVPPSLEDRATGALVGAAVGDALGGPVGAGCTVGMTVRAPAARRPGASGAVGVCSLA
ncbi:hypothetical protein EST92_20085, partial [Streptomyces sp. TM32]